MTARITKSWHKFTRLYRKEIWQTAHLTDRSARGRLYAFLRVISITWTVFYDTNAASRAAALTFSSLLGLGPLVAIGVAVAGFTLDQNTGPDFAVTKLNALISYVVPQIDQYQRLVEEGRAPPAPNANADVLTAVTNPNRPAAGATTPGSAPPGPPAIPGPTAAGPAGPAPNTTAAPTAVNGELVELLDGFIAASRSGTAGVVGALTLIVIVLQLFTSIENAFNEIWGVRRGRSWTMRIIYYWTVLTLGSVLFFATVTLLGASAVVDRLPFSATVRMMLPSLSLGLLIVLLCLFYRFIPNTHVMWKTAFIGALVVAALLLLNNYLAVLYFKRVILTKSFYGSLGILPILMIGLYIFWLFVLVGCQISYAVQNADYRSSQAAWSNLAEATRERLSLVVLLTICRRFQSCLPPVTALQLGALMKLPTQILNECLNRLVDLKLVTPVPPEPGADSKDYSYQPARPLDRINLADFKQLFEHYGDDPLGDSIDRLDPIIKHYHERIDAIGREDLFSKPLDQLFADVPFDESRPPFQTMASR